MFTRILTVCTGNICRSPMAEAVWRARRPDLRVESAGIAALVGRPADPLAQALLQERGIDLGAHRARQLTPEMLAEFELILVMEASQQRMLERAFPPARGKVQRLGRFGDFDIPDPFGQPRVAFEHALALIDRGVEALEAHWG